MTPHEFIRKWQAAQLSERSACQQHFLDLCDLLGQPKPAAAVELDTLRNNWLDPPEWTRTEVLEFPGSTDGPWQRYIDATSVDARGVGAVRYPRIVPKDEECAKQLKKRTLTNLYNERPTWLDLAHKKLDTAVFAAYGWDPTMSDDDLLSALLELNLKRGAAQRSSLQAESCPLFSAFP